MGILARKIFHADAGAAADPHVLEHTVIDEGERLGIARGKQEDDAAIGAWLAAVFFLGPVAVLILRPGHDVRFHADGEIAVVGALHRTPAEIAVLALAGKIHVDPRTMDRAAGRQLPERLLLHANTVLHGQ